MGGNRLLRSWIPLMAGGSWFQTKSARMLPIRPTARPLLESAADLRTRVPVARIPMATSLNA